MPVLRSPWIISTVSSCRDSASDDRMWRGACLRRALKGLAVAVGLLLAFLAHAGSPNGAPHEAGASDSRDRASATEARVPDGLVAADWGTIQRQMRLGRYQPKAVDGGYAAANPAHALAIAYGHEGTTSLSPRGGDNEVWRLGLRLAGVGYERLRPVGEPASVDKDARTLIYQRAEGLTEWWVNDRDGLEQWFELDARPSAGERLTLAIDDTGARYPVTIDPTVTQQAYLKASNTDGDDVFGATVAVDGDTVVVGAQGEDSSAAGVDGDETDNSADFAGAAYVFTRDWSGTWSQQAYLKAFNTDARDFFGGSVGIDGDTVVVGAPGEASSATGVDGDETDNSEPLAGAAYVFTRDGNGTWSQHAYLKASNTDIEDLFGTTVAVDGDTVVVGTRSEDSSATGVDGDETDNSANLAGAAYVFTRDGSGTWSQQAYLKASNTDAFDQFGIFSVGVDGDTVVVGAVGEASSATGVDGDQSDNSVDSAGAAYVFTRDGSGTWSQQAYLKASNADARDQFGISVAVDGDTVVVGAPREDSSATGVDGDETDNSANLAGAAYVFTRDGSGTWSQQAYLKASNTDAFDQFGIFSVGVDGDTVVVGAVGEASSATGVDGDQSDNSVDSAGAAYVFTRDGSGTWSQQAYLKASNADARDQFGISVAVDGDTVVVGAPREDSSATGVDGNQADNSSFQAGAAYVFSSKVDLAIDKTSGAMFVEPGGIQTYTIEVSNFGAIDVIDARVEDDPPARLGHLSWTCTSAGMASCNAGGTGPIDELVTIPASDSVTFTLEATLQDTNNEPVTNTASVTAPTGLTDSNGGNNTDSDTDRVALYFSSFESVEPD